MKGDIDWYMIDRKVSVDKLTGKWNLTGVDHPTANKQVQRMNYNFQRGLR